jgi:hypothetical protein
MPKTSYTHSHWLYLCLLSDMRNRGPILPDATTEDMVNSFMSKHGLTALTEKVLSIEFDSHAKACALENGLPPNYRNPYVGHTVKS